MSLAGLRNMRSQWFPPQPTFTEQHVPSQKGRVFIVTGGNAGIGFELVNILFATGAKIYMASRSKERADKAIETITTATPAPKNPGTIVFLPFDLNDLESVKSAAASFAQQEPKLHVLWNNAGMGALRGEEGAKTNQGFEPMIGLHCIAAQLFTHLLLPQLRAAAAEAPGGSARVVWTSSYMAESTTPENGIDFTLLDDGTPDRSRNYAVSKLGNWLLGREMADRYGADNIISVIQNPGNLKAGSYKGVPPFAMFFINRVLHETKFGGYTGLYAGLSPEISLDNNGAYVIPWGRIRIDADCPRKDLIRAMKPEADGGLGHLTKFWDWCEEQWKPFV
ncbi:hypothetical protein CORC01_00942 [Colletotrichum orchidophilum]|uniref:Short-chain dehydrogenase n=1 Tax=Colletotrichum orchidophilum TaxID=1209926 RepID=A0A1G4BQL1_9PEZI|nr:uncharacterized protein CORC01_00942 [Colletotrichum orchidophilum]OHF03623.1 hypothetical protein CORC01_00942 [Colletotrichum orchidophilum]